MVVSTGQGMLHFINTQTGQVCSTCLKSSSCTCARVKTRVVLLDHLGPGETWELGQMGVSDYKDILNIR